ncbi:hypothetical protein RFI_38481, partial [Reticulomyxa filosa]
FICEYPSHIELDGHCVVKLVDNNNKDRNQITLLSFGGSAYTKKHTLVMKYISVWSNISKNCNEWIPFTDNRNRPIIIGRDENHFYQGVRAVIGGSNNHLLFITYLYKNISVFDLNTFQYIKHDKLPTGNLIYYHCFTGLSIEYDEYNNTFQFHQLSVYDNIASFYQYAYVCINDIILFFGGYGWNGKKWTISKLVYKYSIRENKWMAFQNTLPNSLYKCVAILSEEDNDIHIIGGQNDKNAFLSTHMKTKVNVWDSSQLVMICLFIIYLF